MIHAQNFQYKQLIAPQAKTSAATASAALDTLGADYATFIVNLKSAINTNAVGPTISLLHSDDTVVTNHVTVVANETVTSVLTSGGQKVYQVDLKTKKRYFRLTVSTGTATNDDITLNAESILSRMGETPSSTSEMVFSTNDSVTIVG